MFFYNMIIIAFNRSYVYSENEIERHMIDYNS